MTCYNVREEKNKRREATFVFLRENEQAVCEADNKQEVRACECKKREEKNKRREANYNRA